MAGEGKPIDLKEVFTLLESQETQVTDSIKTLIKENLSSTKESWLVQSLVEYYYQTKSTNVTGILCGVHEPHDKFLLEKLYEGIKSQEHQLSALQLLLHVVCKQPHWIGKVVTMPVLKVVIKCLKVESSIPVLTTGVTIVAILLPSIPNLIGPYLPDLFEIFNRLASFSLRKPSGNTPDIFLLHLEIAVYSLFHRLYGMFPYNFLTYLRHFYTKKENSIVFEEVIKNMLERVRLHPLLITSTKEQETSLQRWRQMETHDVVVECAKMSLDPIEGTWEELHCPITTSRYLGNRPAPGHHKQIPSTIPPPGAAGTDVVMGAQNQMSVSHPLTSAHHPQELMFWSPSEVIGLCTPPPSKPSTPAITTVTDGGAAASAAAAQHHSALPAVVAHTGSTPVNTPRETPPISDEHDRVMSRTGRGSLHPKSHDPKRLSAEFNVSQSVPLLTPSSNLPSVPPSPLKAEFTSSPPFGLQKSTPVLQAARELQFDHDQSDERSLQHVTRVKQSQANVTKRLVKSDSGDSCKNQEAVPSVGEKMKHASIDSDTGLSDMGNLSHDSQSASRNISKVPSEDLSSSIDKQLTSTPNRSSLIVSDLDNQSAADTPDRSRTASDVETQSRDISYRSRTMSDVSGTASIDTVNIDNLSFVIKGLDNPDEDNDDEVSELTSSTRSNTESASCIIPPESIAKFMKNVNRIRFNSLTANSADGAQSKFGASHRTRSCPQFPKIDPMEEEEEEELSRSVSTIPDAAKVNEKILECNEDIKSDIAPTDVGACSGVHPAVSSVQTTLTVTTRQETSVSIATKEIVDVNISKCPLYTEAAKKAEDDKEENEFIRLMRLLLNPSGTVCEKCQGQIDGGCQGPSMAGFSQLSPPELLEHHIQTGGNIHMKELSKLPMPSSQSVNWTHFGGMPPADEISILRGQLMLSHNQLMYERHKRDQHAKRNRRLLRKITNTKTLEEQNRALTDQLNQQELMVRDLQVSLKLVQEENAKLKCCKESEEYEKFVQLRSCLLENCDLRNAKKEFSTLLVRQREDQETVNKKLQEAEGKLFCTQKELEAMQEHASINTTLKDQVLQLQKELVLMGEIQQKSQEKLLSYKLSHAARHEHEHVKAGLQHDLKDVRAQLGLKTQQLEACSGLLQTQQESLNQREITLADLKMKLERVKISHEDELKSVEDKCNQTLRINQSLESHVLQLYKELDELQSKCRQVGRLPVAHHDTHGPSVGDSGKESHPGPDFRERTGSDPLRQQHHRLERMGSAPPGEHKDPASFGVREPETHHHLSTPAPDCLLQKQLDSSTEHAMVVGDDPEYSGLLNRHGQVDRSDTTSVASHDSSMYPRQHMLYTDSEDSRSVSNRSNTLGDSGFC